MCNPGLVSIQADREIQTVDQMLLTAFGPEYISTTEPTQLAAGVSKSKNQSQSKAQFGPLFYEFLRSGRARGQIYENKNIERQREPGIRYWWKLRL